MKQLDKKSQMRLSWFFAPLVVVCILVMLDVVFGVNLNIEAWAIEAMFGCMALVILAYAVAAWRQKCWGMLIMLIILLVFGALNISNIFVKLILPDAP